MFNLTTNTYTIPTILAIMIVLAAAPALQSMWPYPANDAGTELIKVQNILLVQHYITGL